MSLPNESPESEFSDGPGVDEFCEADGVGSRGDCRRRGGGEREPPSPQPVTRDDGVAEVAANVRRLCLLVLFKGEGDLETVRLGGGVAA